MNRFDTIVEYNISGEDELLSGAYNDNIAKLTTMVWDKNSDGFSVELTENDTKQFNEFLSFFESLGFIFVNREELLVSGSAKQLFFMRAIFGLFLNVFPTYFSSSISIGDLESLSEEVKSLGNKDALNFFKYQLPKVLINHLTVSEEDEDNENT